VAAIEQLRREIGIDVLGGSQSTHSNGLSSPRVPPTFVQETHPLGPRIAMGNVAEALYQSDPFEGVCQVEILTI
jgi:hypothetical protein